MDLTTTKHARSFRRLPERPNGAQYDRKASTQTDKTDPVKQDQMFRNRVLLERKRAKEWEVKWGFMKTHDHMVELKKEKPLPSLVSFYSDRAIITSSQVYGSRQFTPLGKEVIRLDRSTLWSQTLRWKKTNPEALLV